MANLGMDATLVAAGTVVTANGHSASQRVDNKNQFRGVSDVTAMVGGTAPTFTVTVETSHDDGVADAWRTVAAFTAQTAVNTSAWKNFGPLDRYVRVSWALAGTAAPTSVTFGVSGEIL